MSLYGDSASAWQACADFYRNLSKISSWSNQTAMIEFVERVAPDAVARQISAGTTHQLLVLVKISPLSHPPTVAIFCWGADARFTVQWRYLSSEPCKEETVDHIDDALWQRIVAWLEQRERRAARPA